VRAHADTVASDTYGSAWAIRRGSAAKGPRVMIEAHADEIGFIVKHITAEGFLHIDRIGGADAATARGRRIEVLGEKGIVPGLIGTTAIHLRRDQLGDEKSPKIHELYVDVGAPSRAEVAKLGLRVGHPAVYAERAALLGKDRLCGRALDNRVGGFILAMVLARLAKRARRPAATVIALNAVQEEIGGHGAAMATHRLFPDVAVVLDVTHATDTPGISLPTHGEVRLGKGPTLTHGTSNHPAVVERLGRIADRSKIPIQHESSSRYSGSDTDSIFLVREGIASALVSFPLRYMHSAVETAHVSDIERTIDLLDAFLVDLKAGERFTVRL